MQLIDEQDHIPVFLQLIHNGLHPLLKLATVLCTSHQGRQIKGDHPLIKQNPGNFTLYNAEGQPFHNSGLTHSRFPNQDRVILFPAGKDLRYPFDLGLTSNNRIKGPEFRHLGNITAKIV